MINLLLFTFIAALSINGAGFRVNRPYQGHAAPQQLSKDVVNELAEASRLSGDVVKLFDQGKFEEALPLAKRVLEIRERYLTPDDERIATAATNLAEIYHSKKKLSDAQQLFERALGIYERKFGPEDRRVSTILDRLGYVHFSRSHYSETEQVWNRSLGIKEKVFGTESREVADLLQKLGEFYRYRRNFNSAEASFDRALMIMRQKLALDSQATEKLVEHFSCLYHETGQKQKLGSLWRKYAPEQTVKNTDKALVSGSVLNGFAIKLPQPGYPAEARSARASGIVVVVVTIDERGKVIEARDMCGSHPSLAKASLEAARKAEFTPTKLSGQPVKVKGQITYSFVPR